MIDYCIFNELKETLRILDRVEEMYREFPESVEKLTPTNQSELSIRQKDINKWTKGDVSVYKFLTTTYFNLEACRKNIEGKLVLYNNVKPVMCPLCKSGVIIFKEGRLQEFKPKFIRY